MAEPTPFLGSSGPELGRAVQSGDDGPQSVPAVHEARESGGGRPLNDRDPQLSTRQGHASHEGRVPVYLLRPSDDARQADGDVAPNDERGASMLGMSVMPSHRQNPSRASPEEFPGVVLGRWLTFTGARQAWPGAFSSPGLYRRTQSSRPAGPSLTTPARTSRAPRCVPVVTMGRCNEPAMAMASRSISWNCDCTEAAHINARLL